jgi:transglutaminase-like putative cysteine protease
MRLLIQHETTYRYKAPAYYSIQQLRLTPRDEPTQRVLSWHVAGPGRLERFVDAYGNITHTMVLSRPHDVIRVIVNGAVDVTPIHDGRIAAGPSLSPLVFSVPTPLTAPAAAVRDFVERHLTAIDRPSGFIGLAEAICETVEYESGATEVSCTAAQALELKRGVCQDHAHLFIACCRAMGVPARYVSGYIYPGEDEEPEAASHAWADVWVADEGWISIDVSHQRYASEQHCRLAIGRDYLSAAPVRGVRTGGGEEVMEVKVAVRYDQ